MSATMRRLGHSMKLAWVTDVHLDFAEPPALQDFYRSVEDTGADAVLLGGDIADGRQLEQRLLEMEKRLDRPLYFVLGNHDYYHASIRSTRRRMKSFSSTSRWARWLPALGVVALSARTALVGHGGWGDGRHGDHDHTPVALNDFLLIEELVGLDIPSRRKRLAELGDDAAASLEPHLEAAAADFEHLLILTHVPPFTSACWHEGRLVNGDWRPFFTCKATGDAIERVMADRPANRATVLCGHTHSAGLAQPQPNVRVLTGGAVYGKPAVEAVFDADAAWAFAGRNPA